MENLHFNARAAKALQAGGHIVVQGCSGLRLEASATRKTWIYRYRSTVDGRLRQVKIGGWPDMPIGKAVARWEELRAARDAGRDPAQEKKLARHAPQRAPADRYTLGQMVEDYAAEYLAANREPKGAKAVGARLRKAIAAHKGAPVAAATRGFVFDHIKGLADTPVVARSVKAEMAAAWRFAQEAGRIPDDMPNWWAQRTSLRLRSKGAKREGRHKGTTKRVLRDDEIKTLVLEDLPRFSAQVQDFLVIMLWCMVRGVEICRMRRSQVRQEGDGVLWWTVPRAAQKNRHSDNAYDLRVPLYGRAREAVLRRMAVEKGDLLFSCQHRDGTVGPQHQSYMQSKVHYMQPYSQARKDHVRQRLKVTHWSPHDLRRTGRTMVASLGCPHEIGEALLGHVLEGVAGDYNLYRYDRERKHWLAALDVRYQAIIAASAPPC